MPEDLKYIINQSQLTDIGDAIRSKLGEQDTYTVNEMPEKIGEISGGGGGGSDLFETVELKINLPDGFGYDLIAPAIFPEEDPNTIWAISEGMGDATATYNIVIPTNGNTVIEIKPSWVGGEVVIVSGDIINIENTLTLFSITGNAEVTVQSVGTL